MRGWSLRERAWHGEGMAGRCPELPWQGGNPTEESYSRPARVPGGRVRATMSDKHKQLPPLGLLVVISAPDMQTLRGPLPSLLLPSWARAGLAA